MLHLYATASVSALSLGLELSHSPHAHTEAAPQYQQAVLLLSPADFGTAVHDVRDLVAFLALWDFPVLCIATYTVTPSGHSRP